MHAERGVVPEYRSIARPQTWAGLPPAYGVMLLMTAAILILSLGMVLSGVVITAFFWAIGVLITWYDPYAWSLFGRMHLVPRILRP